MRLGTRRKRLLLALALIGATSATMAQGTDVVPFTLSTIGSTAGGQLPSAQVNNAHGCKGGNAPPTLAWAAVPAGTKSLALTLYDPTARHGAGFWHWALIDLPADLRKFDLAAIPPQAVAGRNGFGEAGYGGACPPSGETHTYTFTVWALPDAKLPFDQGSHDKEIGAYLATHRLGQADLTFSYKR